MAAGGRSHGRHGRSAPLAVVLLALLALLALPVLAGACGRPSSSDAPAHPAPAPPRQAVVAPTTTSSAPAATPTTVVTPVATPPGWSAPLTALPPGGGFTSVSCISDTFCVAAGGGDNQADADSTGGAGVTDSWDGAAWADPSVYFPTQPGSSGAAAAPVMPAVSCTGGPLCVIVDGTDHVSTGDGTDWSAPAALAAAPPSASNPADPGPGHPGSRHAAVACPQPSLCAMVDNTGHAAFLLGGRWTGLSALSGSAAAPPYAAGPVGLACPGPSACLATVGTATFAWDGTAWHPQAPWSSTAADGSHGTGLSCPEVSSCWLVSGPDAVSWTSGVWSAPAAVDPGGQLDAVSCPTATFCVAVDAGGSVVTWDGTTWTSPHRVLPAATVYTGDPTSVSCPSVQFCMVLDGDGDYGTFHAGPAPGGSLPTPAPPAG